MLNRLLNKLWQSWLATGLNFKFLSLCFSSAFFAIVCIISNSNPAFTGGFLLLSACLYLAWIKSNQNDKNRNAQYYENIRDQLNQNNSSETRNVQIDDGNYNESIGRDYINVHGDFINFNQDFSGFVNELVATLEKLKSDQIEFSNLRENIIHDLEEAIISNPNFRRNLRRWKANLGGDLDSLSDSDAAVLLVNEAERVKHNPVDKPVDEPTKIEEEIYKKLESYLKEGAWKEADTETVEVIIKVLSNNLGNAFSGNLTERHIAVIPAEDLRYIDQLWTHYSNGRFGFSIQKRIAKELYCYYGCDSEFGERVGWYLEGDWIYLSDTVFSIKEPVGHLPLQIYLTDWGWHSHKIDISDSIFQVIIGRLYNSI